MMRALFLAILALLCGAGAAHAGPVFFGVLSAGGGLGAAFAATSVGSFLTTTFVGRLLTSVALSALSTALAPKPKVPGLRNSQTATGATQPLSFILGRYATSGVAVCPPMSHGQAGKTPNAYLTYVIDLGDVPGATLESVIIDGEEAPIGGPAHASYGLPIGGKFAGYAWVKYYDGSQVVADPGLWTAYSGYPDRPWSADMIGRGVCYAVVTFRYNRSLFQAFPKLRFVLGGIPLYDPRLDSTAGGSGAQRWNDRATWAPSGNPVVQVYNIMRGIEVDDFGTWGGRVDASALPADVWMAAMNACDVPVALAGGGSEPAYRAAFDVSVEDEPASVIEELLKACSAEVCDLGGRWIIRVGGPGLPVYFFTDDDILTSRDQDLEPFRSLDQTHNGVAATYPDPAQLWESVPAPTITDAAWQAQDQGRQLIADLALPAVPYALQVQRLMRGWLNEERRFIRHSLNLPPDAAILSPLDSVAWTSERNGYSAKVFEVAEVVDDLQSCIQRVSLREKDATDYDWHSGLELPLPVAPGGVVVPVVQAVPGWNVAGVALSDNAGARRPALRLEWDGDGQDDVRGLEWEIRRAGQALAELRGSTMAVAQGATWVSDGILPGQAYEARARFIVDRPVDWSVWDAATAPDIRFGVGDLATGVFNEIDARADAAAKLFGIEAVDTLPATGARPDQIVLKKPEMVLWRWTGAAWTQTLYTAIEPGSVNAAAFASGLRPVEVVAALPASGNFAGRMAFLTTDQKLYRHNGAAWTAAVDGADLLANSVVTGKISAGAIKAEQIDAGAVRAKHLLIADLANACPNGSFESGELAPNVASGGAEILGASTAGVPAGAPAVNVLRMPVLTASTVFRLNFARDDLALPVVPGEQVFVAADVAAVSANANISVYAFIFDVDGNAAAVFPGGSGWALAPSPAGWRRAQGKVTIPATMAPNGKPPVAASVAVSVAANAAPAGNWYMTNATLRRANAAQLIVDGGITANHLAAGSVVADKIAAGAVLASKLDAGSLGVAGLSIFGGDLKSADFVAGSAGWRITSAGNAEFNDLIKRSDLQVGSVTDEFRAYAPGPFTRFTMVPGQEIFNLSITGMQGGDIWRFTFHLDHGLSNGQDIVLEARGRRNGGPFEGWRELERITINSNTFDWVLRSRSSNLAGEYDEFQYRARFLGPASGYNGDFLREIYLTVGRITR